MAFSAQGLRERMDFDLSDLDYEWMWIQTACERAADKQEHECSVHFKISPEFCARLIQQGFQVIAREGQSTIAWWD